MSRAIRSETRFYAAVGKTVTVLAVSLLCLTSITFCVMLATVAYQDYRAQETRPYAAIAPDTARHHR